MTRHVLALIPAALITGLLACNGDNITTPTTGTLRVTTTTVGVDRDVAGYTLQVDAEAFGPVGSSSAVLVPELASGEHSVSLGDIEANCRVNGENPRNVLLEAGDTAAVEFNLSCGPATGQIRISTATSGTFPDPDGYTFTVDGVGSGSIGATAEVKVSGAGTTGRLVELGGVAANCVVTGENPTNVEVFPGVTSAVAFSVDCSRAPAIAFVTNFGISLVNPDGTSLTRVWGSGEFPRWSPDRSRIAFQGNGDLYTVRPDGTGLIRLTTGLWIISEFGWSPDGTSLVARGYDCRYTPPECGLLSHVWVIPADGGGARSLVAGSNASLSPDGRTLAFGTNWDGASLYTQDISLVEADGSGTPRLLAQGAFQPQWSPDGTRIAFIRESPAGLLEIWLMNPDGRGQVNLTQGRGYDHQMAWSPDGSRLVFTTIASGDQGNSAIGVMNADGTGRVMLTDGASDARNPVWSPDGTQIVFVGTPAPPGTDVEVYVIRADGGAPVNVSHNSDWSDGYPDW